GPTLKSCRVFDCGNGIHGRDQAAPVITDSFVYRCREAFTFINYGAPLISGCVVCDCEVGLQYLHTRADRQPVVQRCAFVKTKLGIEHRGTYAKILDNVFSEYGEGVRLSAVGPQALETYRKTLVCDGNRFWSPADPLPDLAVTVHKGYSADPRGEPTLPDWFRANRFGPMKFKRPDYLYPPDGDWTVAEDGAVPLPPRPAEEGAGKDAQLRAAQDQVY